MAICAGSSSLEPAERVELLAILAKDRDQAIAERAAGALLSQPAETFVAALSRPDAAPELIRYCAENLAEKPEIADALAKNSSCPAEALVRVGRHLSAAGVQALLDDLGRLTSAPGLSAALASCPAATLEQQHLLQEFGKETRDDAGLAEAVAAAEPEAHKRQTLLQRLQQMGVIERVRLALSCGPGERMTLIRDPSRMVARAVLQSPRLADHEVESFAAMTNVSDEILRLIANNRVYLKNYSIVRNLVCNPKTPLDVSLHLLSRLLPQDLKLLAINKNVPETLRSTAAKLTRQRTQARQQS